MRLYSSFIIIFFLLLSFFFFFLLSKKDLMDVVVVFVFPFSLVNFNSMSCLVSSEKKYTVSPFPARRFKCLTKYISDIQFAFICDYYWLIFLFRIFWVFFRCFEFHSHQHHHQFYLLRLVFLLHHHQNQQHGNDSKQKVIQERKRKMMMTTILR